MSVVVVITQESEVYPFIRWGLDLRSRLASRFLSKL